MDTQNQSTGQSSGAIQGQSNFKNMFGQELRELGDRIERIAEKLKSNGKVSESEELYKIGDKVEHFCDKMQ